jgi:hypothetical protein
MKATEPLAVDRDEVRCLRAAEELGEDAEEHAEA